MASAPISVRAVAWTTALGDDLDAVWRRLLAGESGIVEVAHGGARLRSSLAGASASVSRELPASERMIAIARPALERALVSARRRADDPDLQLVLATDFGPFLEPDGAPMHAWADALARAIGARRPPIALSTACAAGADAVALGAELIRAGLATSCVCGGVDVLTDAKRLAHSAVGSMSASQLRAFDERHDGTLLGEGAGFVVLERDPDDRDVGLLRGVGSANDATGLANPAQGGIGARYAIERSLADAGIDPGVIDLINAHGSGTPLNDAAEAAAFHAVFGATPARAPIVFATKGNFGHSLGATGAIEAIALLLAMRSGQVPPVIGLARCVPELRFPVPREQPLACDARFGLTVSAGFSGFNTSLVFGRG